ncbi:MAG TPA: hypothetical protein QF901_03210 [Gammaproteobacteria bacterium]|nr:hypothetical protein [Gammaproteobacteria bacterium]
MPGTSSPLPVEEEGTAACIAVISALAMERAPLDALLMAEPFSPIRVYQSGTGSVRAYDAARSALSAGASALVSWGIAGALTTDLSPGTILLPEHLLNSGGDSFVTDPRWRMEICRVLQPIFTVRGGRILEAAEILSTRGAKMCVAQKSGAIAVDMESTAVARAASGAGKPFIVLRVVLDALSDSLPRGIERWLDEAGNRRPTAAMEAALRPSDWPALVRLASRYQLARSVLRDSAQILVPRAFFYMQPAAIRV